ncbi:hypothetical protein [Candidatus Phytoplasma prunorum]|uniref:hypothetical protein n=1 Tax=Candidatus Phytoplasma prunorum TaxID=47565 RepID=UPI002FF288F6
MNLNQKKYLLITIGIVIIITAYLYVKIYKFSSDSHNQAGSKISPLVIEKRNPIIPSETNNPPSLPLHQIKSDIESKNELKNEPSFTSTHESLISNEPKNESKNEPIKKVKFKITANEFNQIQNYFFSEHADITLLPSHLPANAIDLINQEREYFIKRKKSKTDEIMQAYNLKINEYHNNLETIKNQIPPLQNSLSSLDQKLASKDELVNLKKVQRKQFRYGTTNYVLLDSEIDKLNEEASEIIKQMSNIRVKIKHLEIEQESYLDMLTRVETDRKNLEKDFKIMNISSLLNDFEITN